MDRTGMASIPLRGSGCWIRQGRRVAPVCKELCIVIAGDDPQRLIADPIWDQFPVSNFGNRRKVAPRAKSIHTYNSGNRNEPKRSKFKSLNIYRSYNLCWKCPSYTFPILSKQGDLQRGAYPNQCLSETNLLHPMVWGVRLSKPRNATE